MEYQIGDAVEFQSYGFVEYGTIVEIDEGLDVYKVETIKGEYWCTKKELSLLETKRIQTHKRLYDNVEVESVTGIPVEIFEQIIDFRDIKISETF